MEIGYKESNGQIKTYIFRHRKAYIMLPHKMIQMCIYVVVDHAHCKKNRKSVICLAIESKKGTTYADQTKTRRMLCLPTSIFCRRIFDRFKAILLLWFLLFYVLVLIFGAVCALCAFSYFS